MSKRSGKVRRTERFPYLVADPAEAKSAVAEAALAERRARDTDGHATAKERLSEAERAVESCYGTVVVRALAPAAHQAFVQEFTEQAAARSAAAKAAEEAGNPAPPVPQSAWDAGSVEVRMLAGCDVDPEHTEQWWAEEFDGEEWTIPEREELLNLCYQLNMPRQTFDLGVLGKG